MPFLNNSLFSRLSPVEISDYLWKLLSGDRPMKQAKKKTFLFRQGAPIKDLLILKTGSIKAMITASDGTDIIFEILEAPAVFGHQALFADNVEQAYPNLVAMTDVEVVYLPLREAEQLVDDEPALLKCLYKCILRNFATASSLSVWSQRLSMLQKVAFALTLTSDAPRDENGYFSVTHENLAGLIGVTRTNVTLSLNKLCDLGLIDKNAGKIKILDMEFFSTFGIGSL